MVARGRFARYADGFVDEAQHFYELLLLLVVQPDEQRRRVPEQRGVGGFGELETLGGWLSEMRASVVWVDVVRQQTFLMHNAHLAADTCFGLPEMFGDLVLPQLRLLLQQRENAQLRHADAELLKQRLVALAHQNTGNVLKQIGDGGLR